MKSLLSKSPSQNFNFSNREKRHWFRLLWQFRASVIPAILPRIFICSIFGLIISILYFLNINVSIDILSSVVPSIVLGLLLVFRTNTAYERYWEGRKLWGSLTNTIRNFTRAIWVGVIERNEDDREQKIEVLKLLVAFAVATKHHLRGELLGKDLEYLLPCYRYEKLKSMNNPPLEIAFWIADYLQEKHERKAINTHQLTAMLSLLDEMVDALGGCERILKTPIPLAYSIHLKQLIMLYCLTLPFQIVDDLKWWTAPIVGLISFAVFGIEEIGIEIENPFGYDTNDLPLDTICKNMQANLEDLMSLTPSVRYWQTDTSLESF